MIHVTYTHTHTFKFGNCYLLIMYYLKNQIAKLCVEFHKNGVCAIDLCGGADDEHGYYIISSTNIVITAIMLAAQHIPHSRRYHITVFMCQLCFLICDIVSPLSYLYFPNVIQKSCVLAHRSISLCWKKWCAHNSACWWRRSTQQHCWCCSYFACHENWYKTALIFTST